MTTPEFVQLITTHQSRLYGYILSLVFDRNQADDLLQQTNAVLWRKADEFELGTNFVAWAFRIAYYEVMQHRRKQQQEQLVFDDELVANLAEVARDEDEHFLERQTFLRQCLDQTVNAIETSCGGYLAGADLAKIAQDLGSSVNAVKQMLFRARGLASVCRRQIGGPIVSERSFQQLVSDHLDGALMPMINSLQRDAAGSSLGRENSSSPARCTPCWRGNTARCRSLSRRWKATSQRRAGGPVFSAGWSVSPPPRRWCCSGPELSSPAPRSGADSLAGTLAGRNARQILRRAAQCARPPSGNPRRRRIASRRLSARRRICPDGPGRSRTDGRIACALSSRLEGARPARDGPFVRRGFPKAERNFRSRRGAWPRPRSCPARKRRLRPTRRPARSMCLKGMSTCFPKTRSRPCI